MQKRIGGEADNRKTLRLFKEHYADNNFTDNDLFITIRLKKVKNPTKFIYQRLYAIASRLVPTKDKRDRLVAEDNAPVHALVTYVDRNKCGEIEPHAHILLKNRPFIHNVYPDYASLVRHHLSKSMCVEEDVTVDSICNIQYVSTYALLQQSDCRVEIYKL